MSNQDNNQVRETQDQEEQLRNLCMKWGLLDNEGTEIERSGEDTPEWYGVLHNGRRRYVSKKHVEIVT